MSEFYEPEIDPLADTNPSLSIRPVKDQSEGWRRAAGLFSLLGAALFTFATIILLILPDNSAPPGPDVADVEVLPSPSDTPETLIPPTNLPTQSPTQTGETGGAPELYPTLGNQALVALLTTPVASLSDQSTVELVGSQYEPFTFSDSDRPRSEFVTYIAVEGDTINAIAARFGLQQESIAWCNDRRIVLVLRPGDVLRIPPVDGVCHLTIGGASLAEIAAKYKVDNSYVITDSEYNEELFGLPPETVLPSGTQLFVPGGQGELITWNPGYEVSGTDESGNPTFVTFAPNQAGSCGRVPAGGGSYWSNPLPNGSWVRGFYAGHTGIDLSASPGTPIYAANSGPVLYAGWNSWGYGNTVVLGHGPYSTLYGHMDSLAVRCGDNVVVGQVVGYVGSTGNSTGPHLHFEIRYNNEPFDPSSTAGIGW